MSEDRLTTGWEPDLPASDNLVHAGILNIADRIEQTAERMDGEWLEIPEVRAGKFPGNSMWANVVTFLQPVTPARAEEVGDAIDGFYGEGVEAAMFSPYPTPDFTGRGWLKMGHPPFMFRPPGGEIPPDPEGLEVVEVDDADGILELEDTLARAFPLSAPGAWTPGTVCDGRLVGVMRFWIGRLDGEPVSTAVAHVSQGVNSVEWISTLPGARGRGIGEALTWRATLADPTLPAVLIASDPGRPVYERMGFVSLVRFTGWIKPGGGAST